MEIRDIQHEHRDLSHTSYFAVDDNDDRSRPAVLIGPSGGGLNDHAREVARRLAELGYVALALDYYGVTDVDGVEKPGSDYRALSADVDRTRSIAQAGLELLLADPRTDGSRLAAIGYCFGGTLALELARGGAPLRAVVGFHSGLTAKRPEDARNITGSVLVCIGADDPYVPPDQRAAFEEEMRSGGVDWQMHLYGGIEHGFTERELPANMPGLRYDERADARSWAAMLELFDSRLHPGVA